MRGTLENPQGRWDWKIVNDMARAKIFSQKGGDLMMTNYQGTVINIRTRHEYTPEELMAEFDLSANEAESCYMTFSDL